MSAILDVTGGWSRRAGAAFRGMAACACLLLADGGCGRSKPVMTLAGSTSLQPFAEKWADAYRVTQPDIAIHVQAGGSTAGVQAAISGAAQIGMASRSLTADESQRVSGIEVARDGIALAVHPTLPVHDLLLEQVRAIYSGDIGNWRRLGGLDLPITVITREDGSGTRAAFEALVMGGQRIVASALVQDSTGTVRQMVASDPAAIGYVSIGLVDGSIRALRLAGVDPTEANIDARKYPLVRPFLFVVPPTPRTDAQAFIDWVKGPAGRDLTRSEGLLPPGT